MTETGKANLILTMNTLSFGVCFAAWMMNGVLITFLTTNGHYSWSGTQIGVLMATPVLTGSLLRLPVGILADRFGGRVVYFWLMLLSAAAMLLNSMADSYGTFLLAALGFGLAGASFAVGVAFTSVWFPKHRLGTALGIFGMGNAGTAATLMLAPKLLQVLTDHGARSEGWRKLPLVYAGALAAMAVLFLLFTYSKKTGLQKTLAQRLAPLRVLRVWRFGAYYFLVFGSFVALSQWLVPYYVKSYGLTLTMAGLFASAFSLPAGLSRAIGGWLSDYFGARTVLYWVFGTIILISLLLFFPQMELQSPGEGVMANAPGTIAELTPTKMVARNDKTGKSVTYQLQGSSQAVSGASGMGQTGDFRPWPRMETWQQWAEKKISGESGMSTRPFRVGDQVARQELLVRGFTRISFQANVYIFAALVVLLGLAMGIGMAAVYKHIPTYFPEDVGVVGGLVGVIGGLGGFILPIIFGKVLSLTGIWTTCWMLLCPCAAACLIWMSLVVRRMQRQESPRMATQFDWQDRQSGGSVPEGSSA